MAIGTFESNRQRAIVALAFCVPIAGCPETPTASPDSGQATRLAPSRTMFPFCDRLEGVGYGGGADLPDRAGSPDFTWGPGRHTIRRQLELDSGTVLKGAGSDRTTLYFPQGLMDLGIVCDDPKDCWSWSNGLVRASGSEIGIEGVTIEFPPHRFEHYGRDEGDQRGFNGIGFAECERCWASDVRIVNADVGIILTRSSAVTVDDTAVVANEDGSHLHYAISAHSSDALISNFTAEGPSHHGITAEWGSRGVFVNGILRGGIRLEPEHNGPVADTLYMNILGDVGSVQERNRDGAPVHTSFVNVDGKTWGVPCEAGAGRENPE